jgi:hypothetical protein
MSGSSLLIDYLIVIDVDHFRAALLISIIPGVFIVWIVCCFAAAH